MLFDLQDTRLSKEGAIGNACARSAIARRELLELYRQGQQLPDGVGVGLGTTSSSLLATEIEGEEAIAQLSRFSERKVPTTASWTSSQANSLRLLFQRTLEVLFVFIDPGKYRARRWNVLICRFPVLLSVDLL